MFLTGTTQCEHHHCRPHCTSGWRHCLPQSCATGLEPAAAPGLVRPTLQYKINQTSRPQSTDSVFSNRSPKELVCFRDIMTRPQQTNEINDAQFPPSADTYKLVKKFRFWYWTRKNCNTCGHNMCLKYIVGSKSFRPDQLFKVTEIKQLCYFST